MDTDVTSGTPATDPDKGSPAPSSAGQIADAPQGAASSPGTDADSPPAEPQEKPERDPYAADHRINSKLRSPAEDPADAPPAPEPKDGKKTAQDEPRGEAKPDAGKPDKDKQSRLDQRIGELQRQAREAEERAALLEARLQQQQQAPSQPAQQEPAQVKPPQLEDFINDESGEYDVTAYQEAITNHLRNGITAEVQQQHQQHQQHQQQNQQVETWSTGEKAFMAKHPDYEATMDAARPQLYAPAYVTDPNTGRMTLTERPRNPTLVSEVLRRGDYNLAMAVAKDPARWVGMSPAQTVAELEVEHRVIKGELMRPGGQRPPPNPQPQAQTDLEPPPRLPAGGQAGRSGKKWTAKDLRGKNARDLLQHYDEIQAASEDPGFFE